MDGRTEQFLDKLREGILNVGHPVLWVYLAEVVPQFSTATVEAVDGNGKLIAGAKGQNNSLHDKNLSSPLRLGSTEQNGSYKTRLSLQLLQHERHAARNTVLRARDDGLINCKCAR
jgi:hypothetical protein